jgi:hypothetical protein
VARLTFPGVVDRPLLLDALTHDVLGRRGASELTWCDDLKVTLQEYHHIADEWVTSLTPQYRETADFLVAFGSELIAMNSKPDTVKPTALHMTSGRQKFLHQLRTLVNTMTRDQTQTTSAFAEALWGPWRYRDAVHCLGWDPHGERLHAYEAKSPAKSEPMSVMAAVWLGFEALPLFPTASVANRLRTGGFDANNRYLSWPIWEAPMTLDTLRSVLTLEALTADAPSATPLKARGMIQVYRSYRIQNKHGYGRLRQATRVI